MTCCALSKEGAAIATARFVLALAYLGLLLYAVGATFIVLRLQFDCANSQACPAAADPSTSLAAQLRGDAPVALAGALVLALAWLLCLAALWRAGRRWWFLGVLLAFPFGLWLAGTVALSAAGGRMFPTTWETFGTWRSALLAVLLMSLIGPLALTVATHRLLERRKRSGS
ncbi:MAG TPA: hypothetical protein VGP82_23180 [Ktedonobacterales bacterium]|jgi:hypothetical protein|nr:hypothetical protein [Ktedonobacterales bacterium]